MPHVVGYILDGFSWFLARRIIKPLLMDKDVHVAMANVLAISREKEGNGPIRDLLNARYRVSCHECGRPLFVPELLQRYATAENMAKWLVRFRADQRLRAIMISGFQQIRAMLAPPDEGRTPAKVVLSCLER
jgi:lipid A disaccharide synthetase